MRFFLPKQPKLPWQKKKWQNKIFVYPEKFRKHHIYSPIIFNDKINFDFVPLAWLRQQNGKLFHPHGMCMGASHRMNRAVFAIDFPVLIVIPAEKLFNEDFSGKISANGRQMIRQVILVNWLPRDTQRLPNYRTLPPTMYVSMCVSGAVEPVNSSAKWQK